jgi:hypothetical protein
MRAPYRFLLATVILAGAGSTWGAAAPRAVVDSKVPAVLQCAALAHEDFTSLAEAPTAITSVKEVPAAGDTPAYCDVVGYVQPQIEFELRLPLTSWNGRYFQTGCGGFCGEVRIGECDGPLAGDFAVAAENMGHVGTVLGPALWAVDLKVRVDYGTRSTHVTAVASKAIIERFYGHTAAFSYFRGCSTGGREGLGEAQHFPADFDGIIAGDPAFAGRLGAFANNWDARQLLTRSGTPVFPPEKIKLLHAAVLDACDALDGLKDGIISDPRLCHFDVTKLACPAGHDEPTCLSAAQVASAERIYDGARNSRGERLFPGHLLYGSEAAWSGEYVATLTDSYLKYMVNPAPNRATYSHWDFDFDRDEPAAAAVAALYDPVAPHRAPDLAAFKGRGGKLIVYHGWADQGVSPLATLDYYAKVTAKEGGITAVQSWFRVFMVPGMFHCRGGDAPNTFDFMPGMLAWVEKSQVPDAVIARQLDHGQLVRSRPLFAYPAVAVYSGQGDVNDAANWHAVMPKTPATDDIDWIWAPTHSPHTRTATQ